MAKTRTPEELLKLCEETISAYGTRDSNADTLEGYYFLTSAKDKNQTSATEGVEIVHNPHGTEAIDLVQDLVAGAGLTIAVPAKGDRKKDKDLADAAELFLRSLLWESARAQGQQLVDRAAWLAGMRGCVCGRVIPVHTRLKANDEGDNWVQTDSLPLTIQIRDPRYVYPEFGTDGIAYVVERSDRTVRDIQQSYGESVLPGRSITDKVSWTEYWDATRFLYWADNQLVPVKSMSAAYKRARSDLHAYGGIPYVFEFARQTAKKEPDLRVRPLLASVDKVIDTLDLLDSMGLTFVKQYNGDAIAVYSEEMSKEGADPLNLSPGAVNYMKPDERIEWIRGGRQPLEIEKERMKYDGLLQRGTFPYSLYGQDPGRILAGYALNLLNQSGQMRVRPIVECIERLMSGLCSKALMLAENHLAPMLGGKIEVYTVADREMETGEKRKVRDVATFDAEELAGYWQVDVSLGELMPADEQSNVVLALKAGEQDKNGRPMLSWETRVERFKLTDSPAKERERIDREMALNDPEVQALVSAVMKAVVIKEKTEELAKLDVDAKKILASVQQAKLQMPQIPQMPGGGAPPQMPQQPPPMQGPPQGLPPEMLAAGMQGQLMPGAEMPPEMMGQLPPELAGLPPEQLAQIMAQMQGGM